MAPEDKLLMIKRNRNELREQVARERMAAAIPQRDDARPSATRRASGRGTHRPWPSAARIVDALTSGHGLAHHAVAHPKAAR